MDIGHVFGSSVSGHLGGFYLLAVVNDVPYIFKLKNELIIYFWHCGTLKCLELVENYGNMYGTYLMGSLRQRMHLSL